MVASATLSPILGIIKSKFAIAFILKSYKNKGIDGIAKIIYTC